MKDQKQGLKSANTKSPEKLKFNTNTRFISGKGYQKQKSSEAK